ncbi:MAG: cytochrome P450 [Chloroflexi bacterium]|nr:cytochrome P450 [Chloroflexota bacterium]
MKLADIDLLNLDRFVEGVPHEAFKLLRNEAPVYLHPEPNGPGFWVLTKYHDIEKASQDWAGYSSAQGVVGMSESEYGGAGQAASGSQTEGHSETDGAPQAMGGLELMMLNMDPPRHTKLRKLVNTGFTMARINRLEPAVRQVTTQILDKAAPRGECDFVTEMAAELPLQVIAELIGIPQEDRQKIFEWSNRMIGSADPEYQVSPDATMNAGVEMYSYAEKLASERRENPRDDLMSVLVGAEVDGDKLSQLEIDIFFLLLAVAGNETTRNLISGGMVAFFDYPDQWARLVNDPSLMPTAVEEMLRWVSPVMYFRRTTMSDMEIRGHQIKKGDKVTLWYISANRDEEVFEDPDRFDVGRSPNLHLAFGAGGPHNCLGLNLARLEIRVMFEELTRRMPDIQQVDPAQRLRSNFISGIKHLPVKFTPEKTARQTVDEAPRAT